MDFHYLEVAIDRLAANRGLTIDGYAASEYLDTEGGDPLVVDPPLQIIEAWMHELGHVAALGIDLRRRFWRGTDLSDVIGEKLTRLRNKNYYLSRDHTRPLRGFDLHELYALRLEHDVLATLDPPLPGFQRFWERVLCDGLSKLEYIDPDQAHDHYERAGRTKRFAQAQLLLQETLTWAHGLPDP